jgi:DNA-binding transcriptional regulator YiaG
MTLLVSCSAHTLVNREMAARGWKPSDLVHACAGSPSRSSVYNFLVGQPVSRRCQAQILRAVGLKLQSEPGRMSTAGAEIRRRREDLGLTLRELAATAGMHPDYLRKLEVGSRAPVPTRAIARLAAAFGDLPTSSDAPFLDRCRI